MTFLTAVPSIMATYHEQELIAPAVIFPIIALSVFTLLGFVAWSFRDVANRHTGKGGAKAHTEHGPGI